MVIKKDFLTETEVSSIIRVAIDSLFDEEYSFGSKYNYVNAELTFFKCLASICVENCEDSDEEYEKIFNSGEIMRMFSEIKNARYAYDLLNKTMDRVCSIENVLDRSLQDLLKLINTKMPDLEKLAKKLPKEWQKVIDEHNNIVGLNEEADE